jgi:hypothetical protein
MHGFLVDLSKCSDIDREKYERILSMAFDTYSVAGHPFCYEIMWDRKEPVTDFIPAEFVRSL